MPSKATEAWWGLESFSETAGACGSGGLPAACESRLPGAGSEDNPSPSQIIPQKASTLDRPQQFQSAAAPQRRRCWYEQPEIFFLLQKDNRIRGERRGLQGLRRPRRPFFWSCVCVSCLLSSQETPVSMQVTPQQAGDGDGEREGGPVVLYRRFDSARAPCGQNSSVSVAGLLPP